MDRDSRRGACLVCSIRIYRAGSERADRGMTSVGWQNDRTTCLNLYVCVCVCVCKEEREKDQEREKERETERKKAMCLGGGC